MTQSVKGLPCKEEDSNSFTQNSWLKKKKKELNLLVHASISALRR